MAPAVPAGSAAQRRGIPAVPPVILASSQVPQGAITLVVLRRDGRASGSAASHNATDITAETPAIRDRSPPTQRPAIHPSPARGRGCGGPDRDHPDRAAGPQLPGQRPQQLPAQLHQQRLFGEPAVCRYRKVPVRRAGQRRRPEQRHQHPEPDQPDAGERPGRVQQGPALRRSRRGQDRAAVFPAGAAHAARRDHQHRLPDPARPRHRDQPGRHQLDRRLDGPVLRLRRPLQGLHRHCRSPVPCTVPGSPSARPTA